MRGEFIDLKGERIYYYAAGTRGGGDPIVLIHGFPTSSHVWFDVVPKLPAGHRVIVIDLPGFGRSDPPTILPGRMDGHAVRVSLLLQLLQVERACVVGHGTGGSIAQMVALFPHQVSALGIIGCGLSAFPPLNGSRLSALAPIVRYSPSWLWQPVAQHEIARGYVDADRGKRSADVFLRPFQGLRGSQRFARQFAELRGDAHLMESVASQIAIPTAILAGRDDPFVSIEAAKTLHASIPGSTLRICDSQRHFLPEEAPSEVASTIAQLLAR
jgi:pimeloyl-ACP methyl ester carboxylesterase